MKHVIIHGSFGAPTDNWFPWLKTNLEVRGHKVIVPSFPVDNYDIFTKAGQEYSVQKQNLDSWRMIFRQQIVPFVNDEPVNYIAHSLGPIFLVRMLIEFNLEAKKSILVAPFYQHLNDVWQFKKANQSFCDDSFDFKDSSVRLGDSHVFMSDNDPYVPLDYSMSFADKTDSKIYIIENAGHFNTASGYTEFNQLTQLF
ncbi:alpha/beta hydrolase [Candidatus Saccharibacteria bacterium]|jgi:predicted alpha/beta hydrolase family esterase|nr:alpha/beta hydrolase [Candidatus Saccharibacteria bacterium]MBP9131634.1 alpha/beta hydrolase [Candidatus Saccharibacteria bacterium]